MSYRELRDFTEKMRALGYRRLISVENFRTPNFELVADILFWLVHRYDPSSEISDDISTENARVEFLKSVAQIMSAKAHVKLSIKKLYRADGYAVKELLKITTLLYNAMRARPEENGAAEPLSLHAQIDDLQEARQWATDLLESGSKLHSLLSREEELRQARDKALRFVESMSMNLESNDPHEQIERAIREQINAVEDNINSLGRMTENLHQDNQSLQSKIERKQVELDRAEKRLKSLRKVKPAFMEDYERMENELRAVYEVYVERHRNLAYLNAELAKVRESEEHKKQLREKSLRKMRNRLREEELRILRGEAAVDENGIDDSVFDSGGEYDDDDNGGRDSDDDLYSDEIRNSRGDNSNSNSGNRMGRVKRPSAARGRRRGGPSDQGRVVGSMNPGSDDSSSSSSSSDDLDDDDDDDGFGLSGDDDLDDDDDDDLGFTGDEDFDDSDDDDDDDDNDF